MPGNVMLNELAEFSTECGTDEHLKGGGVNSSAKNKTPMLIKPSGTSLRKLEPDDFLPVDRGMVRKLYDIDPPEDTARRETLVRQILVKAVLDGRKERPSVETPLHESIDYRYVMHTHPVLVNGMTCSQKGGEACNRLFPGAMWCDRPEAGYRLCMNLRGKLSEYKQATGKQPEVIFLKNHGLIVSSDSTVRMRQLHADVMDILRQEYAKAGVTDRLVTGDAADSVRTDAETAEIKKLLGDHAACVVSSVSFEVVEGPITPDHIVYSKSFPYVGELDNRLLDEFRSTHGYAPNVIKTSAGVYGVGPDTRSAELALELAVDGAQVNQLAGAFGGLDYLAAETAAFFDNWEAETYRLNVLTR